MILDRYPDGVRPGPAVLNSFPPLDESGPAAARSCAAMNRTVRPQAISRAAAHVIAGHPAQGWSLLCNGIVLFGGGLLLPDGRAEAPRPRPFQQIAA